jgi:hypothetical protein
LSLSYRGSKKSNYSNSKRGQKRSGKKSQKSYLTAYQMRKNVTGEQQDFEDKDFFDPKDAVSTYTSNQGVEDGLLFDLDLVLPHRISSPSRVAETPLKFITSGLLTKGYSNPDGSFNVANIMDLVQQSGVILSKMPKDDRFASGKIELPSGDKQTVFIAQNETGRFTIMLPNDY